MEGKNLCLLADNLISLLKGYKNDFFDTKIIVFPSIVVEQWFKSYFLKTQGENVLMNVEYKTIKDILPLLCKKKNFKLISHSDLKQIIISILLNDDNNIIPKNIKNYYQNSDIKLNDLASSLSSLYIDYFLNDYENLNNFDNSYQKDLYNEIISKCENYNFGTIEKPISNKNDCSNIYLFGFTKIDKVYLRLISENGTLNVLQCEKDVNYDVEYEIQKAPSTLREIENVHSKICKLLLSGAKPSDIVVIAPNINNYSNDIERVFHQDNVNYPSISYTLRKTLERDNDVILILKKLFEIANKGYFTRLDFYNIVSNKIILKNYDIDEENLKSLFDSIVNLNIYRDRLSSNDWDYFKKRLLLSKISSSNFSNCEIILKDGVYLPYNNIAFNDELIYKISNIIDNIFEFVSLCKAEKYINKSLLNNLRNNFDKWFISFNDYDVDQQYKKIISFINKINLINNEKMSLNLFFYNLFDDCLIKSVQNSNAFKDKITFVDYDKNIVVSTKYIFLLGASSNQIPRIKNKSELDLRNTNDDNDDYLIFENIYNNTLKKLYISYVYKDLSTDEEFYLSPIIDSLNNKKKKYLNSEFEIVPLDETRNYDELFTLKEFSSKKYFYGLLGSTNENLNIKPKQILNSNVFFESLYSTSLSNYLSEPLMWKLNYSFNKDDDNQEEIENEFEPFNLNKLNESILFNKIILQKINGDYDSGLMFNRLKMEHFINNVDDFFDKSFFNNVEMKADYIKEIIDDKFSSNYHLLNQFSISLAYNNLRYSLTSKGNIVVSIIGNQRTYFELKYNNKVPTKTKFLNMYIVSLMDVIDSCEENKMYHIILSKGNGDEGDSLLKDFFNWSYDISVDKAKEILNKIHSLMCDFNNNIAIPIDKINSLIKSDSFDKYVSCLFDYNSGAWRYFKSRDIVQKENDLGFNIDNYDLNSLIEKVNKHLKLIAFLPKLEINNGGNKDE